MKPAPFGLAALAAALFAALPLVSGAWAREAATPASGPSSEVSREVIAVTQGQEQEAAPGVPPSSKMSREVFEAMKSEPLLAATMIFENASRQFNLRVDQEYAHQPEDLRPYLTPLAFAHLSEELLKLHRAGDSRGIAEFAEILDVDEPLEEKIAFIEVMTQAYLEAEKLRKNEAAPEDSGGPADSGESAGEPAGKTESPPVNAL